MYSASAKFDEKEYVQGLQPARFHCEEIATNHLARIVAEKGVPGDAMPLALRRRRDPMASKHVPNAGAADSVTEFEEFALDLAITRSWVLGSQPNDQLFQL